MRILCLLLSMCVGFLPGLCEEHHAQCHMGLGNPSPVNHYYAEEDMHVANISFSSCYRPEHMAGTNFWSDVRNKGTDLWLWLGDNMYGDGYNITYKRAMYNAARNEAGYVENGPVKEGGKIPVMATWDDHDCCADGGGNEFPCLKESQKEFVLHFNVPDSEPMHQDNILYRAGVYNSRMFKKPQSHENGIHSIMLDARSGRDPTHSYHGACQGAGTKMLSEQQWAWLETELSRKSEIKIIASGVQVLPPTDQTRDSSEYCADDSHSGGVTTTFADSISAVGEDGEWFGTDMESWGEIPQERKKLLGLAQRSINSGNAKVVIFVSGDMHWAELMAKKMPASKLFGSSQTLYEVTASGVPQSWNYDIRNSNRLRDRSCDTKGSGPYNQACVFPFRFEGVTYTNCTTASSNIEWCATKTDTTDSYLPGFWGYCDQMENELAQKTFSGSTKTCSLSKYHICHAFSNYGFIEADFENKKVRMGIRTPDEDEEAYHTINF